MILSIEKEKRKRNHICLLSLPMMESVMITRFGHYGNCMIYNLGDFNVEKAHFVKGILENHENDNIVFLGNKFKNRWYSFISKKENVINIENSLTGTRRGNLDEIPDDDFIDGIGELCELLGIKNICLINYNPLPQNHPWAPRNGNFEDSRDSKTKIKDENVYKGFIEALERKGLIITEKIHDEK